MKTLNLNMKNLCSTYFNKVKMSFVALVNGDATNNQMGACMACIIVPLIIGLIVYGICSHTLANKW